MKIVKNIFDGIPEEISEKMSKVFEDTADTLLTSNLLLM